ncbi:hypothetical protein [Streptomyces sp. MNP-20]|uniref:hypothetical protein n=1 Tax=Streptomyces sp. MNP-20 TaxID=2721165 RepID=UPI001554947A|nr:hypothetical protein [Streptomyces sp. MNP-20]
MAYVGGELADAGDEVVVGSVQGVLKLVEPMVGFGGLAASEVVQVQAVGSAAVAGPGGELPPELGAFGMVGEVEHAGEDVGAVYVEVLQRAGPLLGAAADGLGEALHVGGGTRLVEAPAHDDRQLVACPGHRGHLSGGQDVSGVLGQAAQARADVERAALDRQLRSGLVQSLFHAGHFDSPLVLMYEDTAGSRRSLALRQW